MHTPLPARSHAQEPSLEEYREAVIGALGVAFASSDIAMSTLERRLEIAVRARSLDELDALVGDLPSIAPAQGERVTADPPPQRTVIAAFLGGQVRKGRWHVPRQVKVIAVAGGVVLDLRQARFSPGVTEIEVFCLGGGVEVIVPPDVRVESMGVAIMGGFDSSDNDADAQPDAPLVRINGVAVMGGVETKVKLPRDRKLLAFQKKVAQLRG